MKAILLLYGSITISLHSTLQVDEDVKLLKEIFSSHNFTITVENDEGVGVYNFNEADKICNMEYQYRLKKDSKPFKLIDKKRLSSDKLENLRKIFLQRLNDRYRGGDTSYKISKGSDKVVMITQYFNIWDALCATWGKYYRSGAPKVKN